MEHAVGAPVPRKEGRDKVTGKAIYVDDQVLPGMLHGATVRTPCAHGRIRNISFAPQISWDEFTIVTAKDIPGQNVVALIVDDQPYLASDLFQHAEEPVLLLAHPDRYLLEEAELLTETAETTQNRHAPGQACRMTADSPALHGTGSRKAIESASRISPTGG